MVTLGSRTKTRKGQEEHFSFLRQHQSLEGQSLGAFFVKSKDLLL